RAPCHAPGARKRRTRRLVGTMGNATRPVAAVQRMRRRLLRTLAALGASHPAGQVIARAADAGQLGNVGRMPAEAPDGSAAKYAPVAPAYAPVLRGHRLRFPRDHGMHPDFRIEWWYITGWLEARAPTNADSGELADGLDKDRRPGPFGYQITFFRVRSRHSAANPSRFAPRQLLLAHAAIADPALGRLRHDEQAWRVGELASVVADDTRIELPGWRLARGPDDG